jgi:hypothetical protein
MGAVTIRCPETGLEISTGLEVDRISWAALPILFSTTRCPLCGKDHSWSKLEARFVEEPRPWADKAVAAKAA